MIAVLKRFKFEILYIVLLVAAVFGIYSNVYNFEFLYDDEFFIVKNTYLNSFSSVADIFSSSSTGGSGFKDSFYRPMQFFLYLIVKTLFGTEAWAFHLLNLLIHFSNAVLLFLFAKKMRFSPAVSFLIALLWCVHPVHVECVAYKSATADSLHTFFLMLGLNLLLPAGGWRRALAGWFCFLFAILSKETAVLGAPLLTAGVFYFSSDRWNWRSYLRTLPFWALSLFYAVLRKTVLNFDGDFSFYKQENIYSENFLYRVYTFFATLPKYLELMVYPHDLHIDRNFPVYVEFWLWPVVFGAVMCAVALGVVVYGAATRKRNWVFPSFVILWFVSLHLLHAGVLMPLNALFLEHWMYMPSMAFFFAVGAGIQWMWNRPSLRVPAVAGVVAASLALGVLTFRQNGVWSTSISLFTHILRLNPNVARVRHGLAMAYSDRGDNEKALMLYEEALAQQPYPATYHNIGLLYLRQNRLDKGEEYLLKAIAMDPQFHPSYAYLIQLYRYQNKQDKAKEYQEKYDQLKR